MKQSLGNMATVDDIEDMLYAFYKGDNRTHDKLDHKTYKLNVYNLQHMSYIWLFDLDKVELNHSSVHGYGVFAKQNISKHELITFYPADLAEEIPNRDGHIDGHVTYVIS